MRVRSGKWNVQAGEERCDPAEVVQLSPTGLRKLPTPVEPHSEKQRRLKRQQRGRSTFIPLKKQSHIRGVFTSRK